MRTRRATQPNSTQLRNAACPAEPRAGKGEGHPVSDSDIEKYDDVEAEIHIGYRSASPPRALFKLKTPSRAA